MKNNISIASSDKEKLNALFWAERNIRMRIGGEWQNFSISNPPYIYPFLRDIYYSRGVGGPRHLAVEKPRQCGLSTAAIIMALYAIDVWGLNTLYCLPGQRELNAFAAARVGEIIKNSPKVRDLFSNIDNVSVKVGKAASLYFKGMNSPAGLEETPAAFLVRDELDFFVPEHAAMILESLAGSFEKWILDIGHPTYPNVGIDAVYQESTQHTWHFHCPHCNEQQEATWDNNVDIDNCRLMCVACNKTLEKKDLWQGFYVAKFPDRRIRGWQFEQILSPTVELYEQIIKWEASKGIPYKVRLFYNTVRGLPYSEGTKKLTEDDVKNLMTGPSMASVAQESVMGLDVGGGFHLWIERDNSLIALALLNEWEELSGYVDRYNPACVVIDAGPESHAARSICRKLREKGIDAWLCMRSDGLKGSRIIDEDTLTIKVNKTEQFDEFFGKIVGMELPSNLPEEAIHHLVAPIRIMREKPDGSREGAWQKGIAHYADAGAYALEAAKQVKLKKHVVTDFIVPKMQGESKWRGRFGEEPREKPR